MGQAYIAPATIMHFSTIATLCGVIAPTIAAPQSGVNNPHPSRPDTGKWPGYSPGSASTELSFYMCCQGSPESPGIDHYYPPYACIFGPAKGECPQGATSSFPYAWLCTYQSAEFAIVSTVLSMRLMITARRTNNCIYRTAFTNLARLRVSSLLGFSGPY